MRCPILLRKQEPVGGWSILFFESMGTSAGTISLVLAPFKSPGGVRGWDFLHLLKTMLVIRSHHKAQRPVWKPTQLSVCLTLPMHTIYKTGRSSRFTWEFRKMAQECYALKGRSSVQAERKRALLCSKQDSTKEETYWGGEASHELETL